MFKRLFFTILGGVSSVVIALPLGLYWLGLSGVDGLPVKPEVLASQERQLWVWSKARGNGVPSITPLNPYSYLVRMVGYSPEPSRPGDLVAWWVASDYLSEHQRFKGMSWWHLSGAALTIWVTRNWSEGEMLSQASESLKKRGLTSALEKD